MNQYKVKITRIQCRDSIVMVWEIRIPFDDPIHGPVELVHLHDAYLLSYN